MESFNALHFLKNSIMGFINTFNFSDAAFLAEYVHGKYHCEESAYLLAVCYHITGSHVQACSVLSNWANAQSVEMKYLHALCLSKTKRCREAEIILLGHMPLSDPTLLTFVRKTYGVYSAAVMELLARICKGTYRDVAVDLCKASLQINPFQWSAVDVLSQICPSAVTEDLFKIDPRRTGHLPPSPCLLSGFRLAPDLPLQTSNSGLTSTPVQDMPPPLLPPRRNVAAPPPATGIMTPIGIEKKLFFDWSGQSSPQKSMQQLSENRKRSYPHEDSPIPAENGPWTPTLGQQSVTPMNTSPPVPDSLLSFPKSRRKLLPRKDAAAPGHFFAISQSVRRSLRLSSSNIVPQPEGLAQRPCHEKNKTETIDPSVPPGELDMLLDELYHASQQSDMWFSETSSDPGAAENSTVEDAVQFYANVAKANSALAVASIVDAARALRNIPVALFSRCCEVLVLLAQALYEQQEYAKAVEVFQRVRTTNQGWMKGMDVFSSALWVLGMHEMLALLCKDLLKVGESRAETWIAMANHHSLKQNHHQAVKCLQKAIKLDRNNLNAYSALAQEHMDLKEFRSALSTANQAISMCPTNYKLWYVRGDVAMKKGDVLAAEESFAKSAVLNKWNPLVVSKLAATYLALNKLDQARKVLEVALSTNPNHVMCCYQMASVLTTAGKQEAALAYINKVCSQECDDGSFHLLKSKILLKMGDVRGADKALSIASSSDNTRTFRNAIKEVLESIRRLHAGEAEAVNLRTWSLKPFPNI